MWDVENLSSLLYTFMKSNMKQQEERVTKLSRLAATLQNTDAKKRAGDMVFKQERIAQKLDHLRDSLDGRAAKINEAQPNGGHEVSNCASKVN